MKAKHTSPAQLRQIAVYVDEPEPGMYFWTILEKFEDTETWEIIDSSIEATSTWLDAYEVGQDSLLLRVINFHTGPRRKLECSLPPSNDDARPFTVPAGKDL